MENRKKTLIFLILIIILGAILRFWGLRLDLPSVYHPDEHFIVYYGLEIPKRFGNPGWFGYPSMCMYLFTFANVLWFAAAYISGNVSSWGEFYKWYQDDPTAFYLLARTITILWGLLTIWLLYYWGKKEKSTKLGLLSALALSVVFIHVRESHFVTVDVPLTAFMTAGSICLMQLVRTKDKFWFYASIVCTGLATGCKYTGIFLFPGLVAAIVLTEPRKYIFSNIIHAFFSIIIIFTLTTPFSVIVFPDFLQDILYQFYASNNSGMLFNAKHSWFYYFENFFGMVDESALVMCIGVVVVFVYTIFVKKDKHDIPVLLWVFLYLIWLTITPRGWIRWSLPVIPPLIYFGCQFVDFSLEKNIKSVWIGYCLIIFAFFMKSILFDLCIVINQDTRDLAIKWLKNNVEKQSYIYRGSFGPDLKALEKAGFRVITDKSLLSDRIAFKNSKTFKAKPHFLPKTNRDLYFILDSYSYMPIYNTELKEKFKWLDIYKIFWNIIDDSSELETLFINTYENKESWEGIYAPYKCLTFRGPDIHIYKLGKDDKAKE